MSIESIRERWARATPGPWPGDYVYEAVRHIVRNCDGIESVSDPEFSWRYGPGDADPEAIAAAPTDTAALLAVAEAARILFDDAADLCATAAVVVGVDAISLDGDDFDAVDSARVHAERSCASLQAALTALEALP